MEKKEKADLRTQYSTIQYIENLYSAAIQKCPEALITLGNI